MIKAILFDLDGTLIDSESYYNKGTKAWITQEGFAICDEDSYKTIGMTLPEIYDYLAKLLKVKRDFVVAKTMTYFKNHPLRFEELIFPDVLPCLERIKEMGLVIGICSISDSEYVKRFVAECGLEKYVDCCIGGDAVTRQKPYPDIYLKAIEVLNMEQKDAIVVEDSVSGIKAAKKAGMYCIARDASRFHIDQSEADMIIDDLEKLSEVI